ncbi:hypothetical protein [Sphingomonas antarctica]|uniref:hypothetical protein n=1 Tax=Sphingomonas antarctica TaxID=2040274 RepID=UPI0039EB3453
MGDNQVYIDLRFQKALRDSSSSVRREVKILQKSFEEFGIDAANVLGYCTSTEIHLEDGQEYVREILVKFRGAWTTLWLETREPAVFVLYDRNPWQF